MKILITGGAGFIGSFLVNRLADSKHDIVVVDDLSRGKFDNIDKIKKVSFIKSDICDTVVMDKLIKKNDVVFHLAALARVMPSIDDPELTFHSNINGTEIVARLCSKYEKKLIFTSSREIYGEPLTLPVAEDASYSARNPYSASKIASEKIIESYSFSYHLNYTIIRLTNVYGANDYERVIPLFINAMNNNKKIYLYGKKKLIDFVYIDDVVDSLIKIMNSDIENEVFNIGSGKGYSLMDLINLLDKIIKPSKTDIHIESERTGEIQRFIADISKAKKILGWSPKTSLENGLKKTVKWYDHIC
ncbi:MAG: NAD-dependent epimerase/dehydratase family protein [Candidatus Thermoplasmatota archaeon]|jgi:UDP-glucose 4-epimerase|nr:NAD-dependent epimerase/dehydratase family protein [Candidatus Thermoplasmatota archaeon]MCL5962929.1 NAD-dependent epimerase/dehydratase family protein [Candidatus Thermoplasmatota archaeon]